MEKYAKKLLKYIRKGARNFMIWLAVSFSFLTTLVFENEISSFLSKSGITISNIFSFVVDRPVILFISPVLVLTVFLVWAVYRVFIEHNWDDVLFANVYPSGSAFPFARIQMDNKNDDYLKGCKAELINCKLINDFRKDDEKYYYQPDNHVFPVTLAWFVDGKEIYSPINIAREGQAFILVAVSDPTDKKALARFCTNIKDNAPIISMHTGEYRAIIKVFAELKDTPLEPKTLDRIIFFSDGNLLLQDNEINVPSKRRIASKPATQHSVQRTAGILRRFQAFFKHRKSPAPKPNPRPPSRR